MLRSLGGTRQTSSTGSHSGIPPRGRPESDPPEVEGGIQPRQPNINMNDYSITRIKNDINGNPRRVIHFLAFTTDEDKRASMTIHELYDLALKRAKKVGGRKFHNKQYGGGIVFQAYSDDDVYALVSRALTK